MGAVTAKRVVAEVVEPAMDSRALNLDQSRLLHNPDTPEIDSYMEYVASLAGRGIPADVIAKLEGYGWLLVELNGREGTCATAVAGNGEQIARDLRPANGGQSLKRPDLARRLRPILDVYVDLHDPKRPNPPAREITLARSAMREVQKAVPIETLLSPSLAHELGETKARRLHELIGETR